MKIEVGLALIRVHDIQEVNRVFCLMLFGEVLELLGLMVKSLAKSQVKSDGLWTLTPV